MIDEKDMEERIRVFRDRCSSKGLKLTHQRLEIYRTLISTDRHPDAESVFRDVRKRIPTISLDTVYRNLRELMDHGLISMVGLPFSRFRFDGNLAPHHHFVCIKCGRIQDFTDAALDGIPIPDEARKWGSVRELQVNVKGICRTCLEKEASDGAGTP